MPAVEEHSILEAEVFDYNVNVSIAGRTFGCLEHAMYTVCDSIFEIMT